MLPVCQKIWKFTVLNIWSKSNGFSSFNFPCRTQHTRRSVLYACSLVKSVWQRDAEHSISLSDLAYCCDFELRRMTASDSFGIRNGKKCCVDGAVICVVARHYSCDEKRELRVKWRWASDRSLPGLSILLPYFFSGKGGMGLSYSKSNQNAFRIDGVRVQIPPGACRLFIHHEQLWSEITSHCSISFYLLPIEYECCFVILSIFDLRHKNASTLKCYNGD